VRQRKQGIQFSGIAAALGSKTVEGGVNFIQA